MVDIKAYKLEHSVYIEVKRFCRKYPKMLEEYNSLLGRSPVRDGQPHGSGIGDPTGSVAMKMMEVAIKLDAIYKPMLSLPRPYQRPVFDHVVFKEPWPDFASISTWRRWQYIYLYRVAKKGGFITNENEED